MHEVYLRQRTFKSTSDIIGRSNTHKTTALFKMKSSADMGMQKNDRQQSQPQTSNQSTYMHLTIYEAL